jgi:hypothetical protein
VERIARPLRDCGSVGIMCTARSSSVPFALVLAVSATSGGCGAAPGSPAAPAPAAGPPSIAAPMPPPDVWPVVLAGTGRWTLLADDGRTLVIEAHEPRRLAGGEVVRLRYTQGETVTTSAPTQVACDGEAVHLLDASLEDGDVLDALAATSPWPRRAIPLPPQSRADGLYATVWRAPAPDDETIVCYGEGPPPDAPECDDVCFSELCVGARGGIVQLSGRWAPDAGFYAAAGYADFTQRFTVVRSPTGQP